MCKRFTLSYQGNHTSVLSKAIAPLIHENGESAIAHTMLSANALLITGNSGSAIALLVGRGFGKAIALLIGGEVRSAIALCVGGNSGGAITF
ncbi:MAG: hypothetical protein F6K30_08645 [Cyanothece sp. SIO2G6]|nr:hypothetical protein [Cyanothece sp. SIO2G6]